MELVGWLVGKYSCFAFASTRFESLPGYLISCLMFFVVFVTHTKQMLVLCLRNNIAISALIFVNNIISQRM